MTTSTKTTKNYAEIKNLTGKNNWRSRLKAEKAAKAEREEIKALAEKAYDLDAGKSFKLVAPTEQSSTFSRTDEAYIQAYMANLEECFG